MRRFFGNSMRRVPARNWPVGESATRRDLIRGALGYDVAAVLAGAGADVEQMVGGPHRVLVVLDDQDRVAKVAQPLERRDQSWLSR